VSVLELGVVEELDVGLVEAVVFKLPLVFSLVVLGLEELVAPYDGLELVEAAPLTER
jgi:hypothetical protein